MLIYFKKKKDTLDEIADEISSKPEKQSLNETEKNEINEEKEEENDENSQEKKINEKRKFR